MSREAEIMAYVGALGYPVPTVYHVDGPDLVMELLEGPTMAVALGSGTLERSEGAAMLADLHDRLHALPSRPGARVGHRVIHLDLHPENVMLVRRGPVVIDWRNATDGPPELDVALSALILAQLAVDSSDPRALVAHDFLADFLTHIRAAPVRLLDEAVARRRADPNATPAEGELLDQAADLVRKLTDHEFDPPPRPAPRGLTRPLARAAGPADRAGCRGVGAGCRGVGGPCLGNPDRDRPRGGDMPIRSEKWPAGTPCWLDISLPDLAAGQEFYGAVLGWEFEDKGEDYGHYTMASRNTHDAAALMGQQSPDQPIAWTMYFATDDAKATAKAIGDNGGKVIMGPMTVEGLGSFLVAADPQGATFGAWEAGDYIGASLHNEPGGLVWEQLQVPDAKAAQAFYGALFPTLEFSGEGGDLMFRRPGEDESIGGMSSDAEGSPQWLCYFAVDDAAKAEAMVIERGGSSVQKVEPTEWGNLGAVADPWGARFGLGDAGKPSS